jgi:1-aminocyclopropane-1-carboxylate deaminase/D-cysteine desulfhydrase-like pyridoxal-dependent ACC family enzyme
MRGAPEPVPAGNFLCTALLGAGLHFVDTADPYADDTIQAMRACADAEAQKGHRAYLIHLGTFSGPLAAVGYMAGAAEIFRQAAERGVALSAVYAPAGSGGTHAGLLAGARLSGERTRIVSASVNVDAKTLARNVSGMMAGAAGLVGAEPAIPLSEVEITGDFIHPGYGRVNAEGAEAIRLMAETEGVLLDPVYTGKALAALIRDVRNGRYTRRESIVFLHTGGAPNLFTHGPELLNLLNSHAYGDPS